ncbi:hypothetical protein [Nocardia testacea]|uniref:hypothetical protein n=1 Tax=Nocardia testacea TaxID=248551 RepID=UPI003A880E2A
MSTGSKAELRAVTDHLTGILRGAVAHKRTSWLRLSDEIVRGLERLSSSDKPFQWFRRPEQKFEWFGRREQKFEWFSPRKPATPTSPTASSFKLVSMRPEYIGENLPGNTVFFGRKVEYLTDPKKRERFRIHIVDGKMYDAKGKLFDTTKTFLGQRRDAIFVVDEEGRMYAHKMGMNGKFHHSSLLAGGPVAGAGTMRVEKGVLTYLSDRSGHYLPARPLTYQVIAQLRSLGVAMDRVFIDLLARA